MMQDRYAGDVGDFGKLGLLRQIAGTGLKVGVNWYRTYKPEEHDRGDGKHISYLNNKAFRGCDDQLLAALEAIVAGGRSVAALEQAGLIPGACFYGEILKPGSDRDFSRRIWHQKALAALAEAEIIFCDPDNGLLVKSVSLGSAKSDKYVTADELISYYQKGQSVIFYNHRPRQKETLYLARFTPLRRRTELSGAHWMGLKFARGSVRDYLFILQADHVGPVQAAVEKMMQSNWQRHFSLLDM